MKIYVQPAFEAVDWWGDDSLAVLTLDVQLGL